MAQLGDEVLGILNGSSYIEHQAGEEQQFHIHDRYLIRTTTPGAGDGLLYSVDFADPKSANQKPVVFTAQDTLQFISDQYIHFRVNCGQAMASLNADALMDLAVLRYIAYRNRLTPAMLDLNAHHVSYYDVEIFNPTDDDTLLSRVTNAQGADQMTLEVANWLKAQKDHVRALRESFTNIVCIVAYVFRQKGHHFTATGDYLDTYNNMWAKVMKGTLKLNASWEHISTVALHAIVPDVLDAYWTRNVQLGRCAAPLILRHSVPAAGTAAVFALSVGWRDAQHIYHRLLTEHQDDTAALNDLTQRLATNRWIHGINGRYYGADCTRLDLSRFSALAATVVGVYESAAGESTLLQSKSLVREAKSAPLQKDIASRAAKQLRRIFIRQITDKSDQTAEAENLE